MIKFNLHNVTDTETGAKARVTYHINKYKTDDAPSVTIYEKNYRNELSKIFDNITNNSDSMTDYFEENRVIFRKGDAYYEQAMKAADRYEQKQAERWEKHKAKVMAR